MIARIELLMPCPTTNPPRWYIDEVWWRTDVMTVEEAYARWPFHHGWRLT